MLLHKNADLSLTSNGIFLFGLEYLAIKSYKINSESAKSELSWLLAYLCTLTNVSLKSSNHQTNFLKSEGIVY